MRFVFKDRFLHNYWSLVLISCVFASVLGVNLVMVVIDEISFQPDYIINLENEKLKKNIAYNIQSTISSSNEIASIIEDTYTTQPYYSTGSSSYVDTLTKTIVLEDTNGMIVEPKTILNYVYYNHGVDSKDIDEVRLKFDDFIIYKFAHNNMCTEKDCVKFNTEKSSDIFLTSSDLTKFEKMTVELTVTYEDNYKSQNWIAYAMGPRNEPIRGTMNVPIVNASSVDTTNMKEINLDLPQYQSNPIMDAILAGIALWFISPILKRIRYRIMKTNLISNILDKIYKEPINENNNQLF